MNKMRILVTGASGFIGSGIVRMFRDDIGGEVFALSRSRCPDIGITPIEADILDFKVVNSLFERFHFDVVIHLAAITTHKDIVDNKFQTFDINLKGTENLLKAFNSHCNSAVFFYASTGKVYGDTDEMPISESATTKPMNILGKTKRITEEVIDFYAQPSNRYIIGRIFNVYGEHQKPNFIVPTILSQLENKYIKLGNVTDKRDYLYIDDLLRAIVSCVLNRDKFAPVDYVNIGSGQPISVNDILHELEKIIGRKIEVQVDSSRFRKDETVIEFCSNDKLMRLTGWKQNVPLKDGLKRVFEWYTSCNKVS